VSCDLHKNAKTSISAQLPADTARMQSPGFFIKQIVIFFSLFFNFFYYNYSLLFILRAGAGDENFKWPLTTKFTYKKRSKDQGCRVKNDLDLIFAVELRPPAALLLGEAATGGVEAKQAKQRADK